MFVELRNLKILACAAVLALMPLIAACGGGGGGEAESAADSGGSGSGLVTCIIVILATGQTDCTSSGSSSGKTSSSPTAGAPTQAELLPASISDPQPLLRGNQELESNNELVNANLPQAAIPGSGDQKVGWYVAGSIDDVTDVMDAFAFTPNRSSKYVLALCPPQGSGCDETAAIDTLTAFVRVLDQDGNVLLSSQADTNDGNRQQMTFDAGVLYYITVNAGDTMGVKVDYRLFVYESN